MSTYNRVVAADENASLAPAVRARLATEMADPTSTVGASLSGTFETLRPATIVLFGDSRTSDCNYAVSPNFYTTNMDWFGWGNSARIGGPTLDVIANAGVGGNTTTQMLARMQTDVLDLAPGYITIWGGTNDSWTVIADVDDSYNNMVTMIGMARAKGIYVFVISETTSNIHATTFPKFVSYYNDRLSEHVAQMADVEFWDFNSVVTDPASAFGFPKTAMLRDGIHLGPFGASTVGKAVVAPVLEKMSKNLVNLAVSQVDSRSQFASSRNLVDNSLMLGTAGTVGAGHTGSVPTYWTSSGNVAAWSVVARADGVGNDAKCILSADSTSSLSLLKNIPPTDVAAGETYIIEASLNIDAISDVANLSLTAFVTVGGVPYRYGVGYPVQAVAAGDSIATGEYILRSAPFTIPAGTVTNFDLVLRAGPSASTATATFRLGRATIRQVT